MTQSEPPELPSEGDAIALLVTLEPGDYTPPELFAVSPDHGLAGIRLAYERMTPPTRTTRFKGEDGETMLNRPTPAQHLMSRHDPRIHIRDGKVWVTFADERDS